MTGEPALSRVGCRDATAVFPTYPVAPAHPFAYGIDHGGDVLPRAPIARLLRGPQLSGRDDRYGVFGFLYSTSFWRGFQMVS